MKVYGWIDSTNKEWAERPWVHQVRCIIEAPSMAHIARVMEVNSPASLFNLSETGNADEIALATSKPGVIFWRHLDDVNGDWKEGRP